MFNITLLWFLLIPVAIGLGAWWLNGHNRDAAVVGGIQFFVGALLTVIAFWASHGAATMDTEIWNGEVVSKTRKHDDYKRSYDCNCRQVCTGTSPNQSCSQVCDTCYEDRYTVTWNCNTTVGTFRIEHLDSGYRSVYNTPDPQRYTIIQTGDPVAKRSSYTNYIQAVPQTLFRPVGSSLKAQFASLLPAYPDAVYDFYRLDRFLTPGYSSPDAAAWNKDINELLKKRGPAKQVNAIVVIAKTADPNYAYALQDHWEGVNKNDVVLVIGSAQWPKIDFVSVLSWTKSELFKVQLRDEVLALGTIQREPIMKALASNIDGTFERRRMREFEYLSAEIDPPTWVLLTLVIAQLLAAGVVWYLIRRSSRPFARVQRRSFR